MQLEILALLILKLFQILPEPLLNAIKKSFTILKQEISKNEKHSLIMEKIVFRL